MLSAVVGGADALALLRQQYAGTLSRPDLVLLADDTAMSRQADVPGPVWR